MVFLRDEGSVFNASLEEVWAFLDSGPAHSDGHHHTRVRRERRSDASGVYSWEIPFRGVPTEFTMRWTVYPPLGIVYEVLAGPFAGSTFFLYYTPLGTRTGVTVVGDFRSPTLPESETAGAVEEFFAREFEEDFAAIVDWRRSRSSRATP